MLSFSKKWPIPRRGMAEGNFSTIISNSQGTTIYG
jgi:hypothetical protein